MTKLIAAVIIVLALCGVWQLFLYWEKVKNEEETQQKQDAAATVMGDQLPGVPYQLEESLQAARTRGAAGLRTWLKTHAPERRGPAQGLDRAGLLRGRGPGRSGGSQARLCRRQRAHRPRPRRSGRG